ncbi:MAG: hypothetical protein U0522_00685 [Candidatus Paceibacterota bacterium]
MKKLQDVAGLIFICAVALLSIISVLGIWDFFASDVIVKSFETLGLLAAVAVVIMVAGKFMQSKNAVEITMPVVANPAFQVIRSVTVVILIISAAILALLGVLAIWDVIADKDVLYKSLGSVAVLAFGSFIIVMTCLQGEGNTVFKKQGRNFSIGGIVLVIVLAYFFFVFSRLFF